MIKTQRKKKERNDAVDQQIKWYRVRDTLLGDNYVACDALRAVDLAADCSHPEAVWLTSLFHEFEPTSEEDVFIVVEETKRVCFSRVEDMEDAANIQNDAFAQATLCLHTDGEECFQWAQKAAAQGERDGFFALAECFSSGEGCELDLKKADENYRFASALGHVSAARQLGRMFPFHDPKRYKWLARAFSRSRADFMALELREQLALLLSGTGRRAQAVFAIGRELKRAAWDPMLETVQFYELQLAAYQRAVNTWSVVATRNRVVKDIRIMIGKMIWSSREEALY
jgi:TPR repeat protein